VQKRRTYMVHVQLAKDWTDNGGTAHPAGETVDVDAATLARLEKDGIVVEPEGDRDTDWPGPTGRNPDWPGPTAS
jgi:hypothetical protein